MIPPPYHLFCHSSKVLLLHGTTIPCPICHLYSQKDAGMRGQLSSKCRAYTFAHIRLRARTHTFVTHRKSQQIPAQDGLQKQTTNHLRQRALLPPAFEGHAAVMLMPTLDNSAACTCQSMALVCCICPSMKWNGNSCVDPAPRNSAHFLSYVPFLRSI